MDSTTAGYVSVTVAKEIFPEMVRQNVSPKVFIDTNALVQISDTSEIEKIAKKVIDENPKEAERYKNGETKLLGFFVGKIMKETGGKANPKIVNELLISNLR